jgi:hypothetical protein
VTGGGRSADGKHKTTQDKTTQLTVAVHPKVALFTKRKVVCGLNSGLLYTGTSLTDKAFEKMPKDSPDWFNYTISGKSLFVDPQRHFDKANNPGVTMYTLVDGKAVVSSALTTYPDYHGVRQGALCCGDRKDRQDGKWNLYTIDEDGSIIEVDSLELDVFYVSTVVGFEVDASKKNSLKVLQERKRGAAHHAGTASPSSPRHPRPTRVKCQTLVTKVPWRSLRTTSRSTCGRRCDLGTSPTGPSSRAAAKRWTCPRSTSPSSLPATTPTTTSR